MTATAAEALELALWLHRAPSRRAALLGRPLPDGIGQLLRVASGARDQVAAAATISGEDEATILEAVRFYLQQILFHEEADAYRVLGLQPGAPHAQAREHHRLLQQWLHPDRHDGDAWETIYATRINRAWSHLRTPQSRAAYDASLVPAGAIEGRSRRGGEYQTPARPVTIEPTSPLNRSRNLTLVVLLGCIGLLVLIALRQETPPQWQDFRPSLAKSDAVPVQEHAEIAPIVATLGAALVEAVEAAPVGPTGAVIAPPSATGVTPATELAMRVNAPKQIELEPLPVATTLPPREKIQQPREFPEVVVPVNEPSYAVANAKPVAEPPRQAPVPVAIPNAFDRMIQARARARQVSAYLGDLTAAAPPVWNDVETFHRAQRLRAELHKRLGMPRQVELEWLDPKWRLNADGAWLETGYLVAGEQGRLDIAFGWREEQLLVRSIDLVPGT